MTRRGFLASMASPARRSGRPNIVLILADDLGFSDLGCYGGEIRTPNLDGLAGEGVRFTQFYNNARCCPTRASLLTGLYPHQAGIGYMEPGHPYARGVHKLGLPAYQGFLNRRCLTIAEALKSADYQCFLAGKWHVGRDAGQLPLARGFDRFYGIPGGAASYFSPAPGQIYSGNEPVTGFPPDFYTTDAFTSKAIEFISGRDPSKPYFLYLAFNAPHFHLDAWPEDIARYRGTYRDGWDVIRRRRFERQKALGILDAGNTALSDRHPLSPAWEHEREQDLMDLKMAVYAAVVDRMDQNIGRLLSCIRGTRDDENTLVVFLSDNGGEMLGKRLDSRPPYTKRDHAFYLLPWGNTSNTPFRQFKQMVHEGGISTPFIARWPRMIPSGFIEKRQVGHVMDLWPTFLHAAGLETPRVAPDGGPAPRPEGKSLLPVLRRKSPAFPRTLFWEHGGNRAVRRGDDKLVSYYNEVEPDPVTFGLGERTGPWELYDMAKDRAELRDLSTHRPRQVRELETAYNAWAQRAGVVPWERILQAGGWLKS